MKTNYVKAAIIGTQDYHEVMRCAAEAVLFRRAGYTAQVTQDTTIELNPVLRLFERYSVHLMRYFVDNVTPYGIDTIRFDRGILDKNSPYSFNSRMPYLVIAWILIGADNPYRCNQYVKDETIMWRVAQLFVAIALGHDRWGRFTEQDAIETEAFTFREYNYSALLAYDTAIHAARIIYYCPMSKGLNAAESIIPKAASAAYYAFGQGHGDAAESAIKKQIQNWQHIPDEAVVSFAHEVVMHSLAAKKTNPDLE
jgi:hypothetical protein